MKTSVIEVRDMLSVLSVLGVEERIGEVPGVESVTVNFSAGSATVRYDETRLDIADIKSGVRQRAHEADAEPAASMGAGDADKAARGAQPATPESAPGKAAAIATPPTTPKSAPEAAPAAAEAPPGKS